MGGKTKGIEGGRGERRRGERLEKVKNIGREKERKWIEGQEKDGDRRRDIHANMNTDKHNPYMRT